MPGAGQIGERQPVQQRRVGGEPAGADAVGDDRQRLAARRTGAGQGFRGGQQILEAADAEHAGAAQGGLEGQFGLAGAVVQQAAAGADGHHRAKPGGGAGGGQEGAAVLQPADVEQDGAGVGVAGEPVEHEAEADIRVAADADDMAEADAVRPGPVDHRAAQGGRLRHQPEAAGRRRDMRAAGVQADAGDGEAEGARAEHAHAGAPGGVGQALGRAGDQGGVAAAGGQSFERRADAVRRAGQHGEVGRGGQVGRGFHRLHRAAKRAEAEVGGDLCAGLGAGADHRHGAWPEQRVRVEAAGGVEARNGHDRAGL